MIDKDKTRRQCRDRRELVLHRETIRVLSPHELRHVGGGTNDEEAAACVLDNGAG